MKIFVCLVAVMKCSRLRSIPHLIPLQNILHFVIAYSGENSAEKAIRKGAFLVLLHSMDSDHRQVKFLCNCACTRVRVCVCVRMCVRVHKCRGVYLCLCVYVCVRVCMFP
jgi:hypothetical protein